MSRPTTKPKTTGARPDVAPKIPRITKPVMFNTREADGLVSKLQVFPPSSPWNEDISDRPVHPDSEKMIASMGANGSLAFNSDMGYIIVPPNQKKVAIDITDYPGESNPGPHPIPDNAPMEGWPMCANGKPTAQALDQLQRAGQGDRHVIVLDPYAMKIYELFLAHKTDRGWRAAQASVFDLKSNTLRPDGWTSADAAGLPIFPAAVKYHECEKGMVTHAIRVTMQRTRKAYVYPATHFASTMTDKNLPRMGERLRLRKNFDISKFPPHAKAILKGLKKYGMLVADNGASWRISVTPDTRFKDLHSMRGVKGRDFEVIVPTGPNEGPRARHGRL